MCVIVIKYRPEAVSKYPAFEQLFSHNPDGVGIAVWDPRTRIWRIAKETDDERARQLYARFIDAQGPAVVHFRLGTTGVKTVLNVHPFYVRTREGSRVWVFHNGVLPGWGNALESDTRELCVFLSRLRPNTRELVQAFRDHFASERFALCLPNAPRIVRVGRWAQRDGLWFSNLSWEYVFTRTHRWVYRDGEWHRIEISEPEPTWHNVGGVITNAPDLDEADLEFGLGTDSQGRTWVLDDKTGIWHCLDRRVNDERDNEDPD